MARDLCKPRIWNRVEKVGDSTRLLARAVKNPLKRVICLHTFIERVIHSMSCIMPGFSMSSYFQSASIESSRHVLKQVVTTWSSRDESSATFCTSTSISFTSGKHYTPHPLPLTTRLLLSQVVSALRRLVAMWVYWTWMIFCYVVLLLYHVLLCCASFCHFVQCCAMLCYVDVWETVRRIYISGLELKKNVNVFCLPMEHRVIEL